MIPAPAVPAVRIPAYFAGLDLGQSNDFTALTVASPTADKPPIYDLVHLERVPLNTRYPDIVSHVVGLVRALRAPVPIEVPPSPYPVRSQPQTVKPKVTLVSDFTGVGRPVADMIVAAKPDCSIVLVTITGGSSVVIDETTGEIRVPKRELASVIQRLLQESRLRIAADLPMANALVAELLAFKVKIDEKTGHDSYEAGGESWREGGAHDDLVLALACSLWFAERRARIGLYG